MSTDIVKEGRPAPEVLTELRVVVDRAKQGDASVLPRLRELLAEFPVLAARYGDLAAHAEAGWAALAAGPDLYLRECLLARAAALRDELAGPAPTPVVRLLVERTVACWLQLYYFDSIEALALGADESPKLALYRARRQEQAHRAYLSALAALTTLHRLLPAPAVAAAPMTEAELVGPAGEPWASDTGDDVVLPAPIRDRLAGLFEAAGGDEPSWPRRKREPATVESGPDPRT